MDFKNINGNALNYFLANSIKPTKYEDTLPDLLDDESGIRPHENHTKEKADLFQKLVTSLYPKMFALLKKGYNIVLHGYGSKRRFIDEFVTGWLDDSSTTITIYGYKEVNQRQILSAFQEALELDKMEEDHVIKKLEKLKRPLFLVIHSFDRLCSRNISRMKPLFNRILTVSSKKVHFITSVDHVNSALLWTCREVDTLNLVMVHCTTFADYETEKSFANLSTSRSSGAAKQRSATAILMTVSNVFDNLPPNSQNIFLLILNYYQSNLNAKLGNQRQSAGRRNKGNKDLDSDSEDTDEDDEKTGRNDFGGKSGKSFEGYPFNALYHDCMDCFYVNSEATLRAQLVEFIDHKLIRSRSGSDGTEYVELLVPPKLIPKLLTELVR